MRLITSKSYCRCLTGTQDFCLVHDAIPCRLLCFRDSACRCQPLDTRPAVRTAPPRPKLPQRRNAHAGQGKRRGGVAAAGDALRTAATAAATPHSLRGMGCGRGVAALRQIRGGGTAGAGDGVAGGAVGAPAFPTISPRYPRACDRGVKADRGSQRRVIPQIGYVGSKLDI